MQKHIITAPSVTDKVTPCFGQDFSQWRPAVLAGGVLPQDRSLLMPGLQLPERVILWAVRQEMNPPANGEISPQVKQLPEDAEWEMWGLTGLGKGPSPSWSQNQTKNQNQNPSRKTPLAKQHLPSPEERSGQLQPHTVPFSKQQNYSLVRNSCLNDLHFSWRNVGLRRLQPAHEPSWYTRGETQGVSNGFRLSVQILLP